jgi:hypothetical protein
LSTAYANNITPLRLQTTSEFVNDARLAGPGLTYKKSISGPFESSERRPG